MKRKILVLLLGIVFASMCFAYNPLVGKTYGKHAEGAFTGKYDVIFEFSEDWDIEFGDFSNVGTVEITEIYNDDNPDFEDFYGRRTDWSGFCVYDEARQKLRIIVMYCSDYDGEKDVFEYSQENNDKLESFTKSQQSLIKQYDGIFSVEEGVVGENGVVYQYINLTGSKGKPSLTYLWLQE